MFPRKLPAIPGLPRDLYPPPVPVPSPRRSPRAPALPERRGRTWADVVHTPGQLIQGKPASGLEWGVYLMLRQMGVSENRIRYSAWYYNGHALFGDLDFLVDGQPTLVGLDVRSPFTHPQSDYYDDLLEEAQIKQRVGRALTYVVLEEREIEVYAVLQAKLARTIVPG